MSEHENKAALRRAIDRWNGGDLVGYLQIYDPDCVVDGYGPSGALRGVGAVEQFYRAFWAAFPGSRITLEQVIAEGDRVAAGFRLDATHEGDFQGIPATGKQVTMGGMTILRFAGGKLVERWSQADFLGLLQQLGAIPTPEPGA